MMNQLSELPPACFEGQVWSERNPLTIVPTKYNTVVVEKMYESGVGDPGFPVLV
jgi:hypothetical protein